MKRLLLLLSIIFASLQISDARGFEGISVGFDGGYSLSRSIDLDVFYAKANLKYGDRFRLEPRLGFFYGYYEIDHYGLKNLWTETAGFLMGVDMFPFKQNLSFGFRFDFFSYNNFSSYDRMWRLGGVNYKKNFGGTNLFANIGYEIPLSFCLALKLGVSPGVRIAYLGDYEIAYAGQIDIVIDEPPVTTFDCPFSIGLVFKVFQRKGRKK